MTASTVAFLHYGNGSGVIGGMATGLSRLGYRVCPLLVPGPLEWRSLDGRPRVSAQVGLHLAASALQFGRRARDHRWNTPYAFDVHSRRAGSLLERWGDNALVLQSGALFAPGDPPRHPYVLLLDHTRALSMERPGVPEAGFPPPVDYGPAWHERERALYQRARGLAVFSQAVATSLQRHYGLPAGRIHVVGAGTNIATTIPPRDDDGRTLCFIGRDWRRKGGPVLLRAFGQVRRRVPDAALWIVGPPQCPDDLPEGARWLGPQPFGTLPLILSKTSVFVLPTLREPFGIAYLDAMACGVPCVGTRIEAVPEVVPEGECGLLVPPADADALAEALVRLLLDPALRRRMGEAGRTRVDTGFRWEHVAARLSHVLADDQSPAVRPVSGVA